MQPSMGSQRVGLDENNLEIPGGNQGVAESGQNHEGPKKTKYFNFLLFQFCYFIYPLIYLSITVAFPPPTRSC